MRTKMLASFWWLTLLLSRESIQAKFQTGKFSIVAVDRLSLVRASFLSRCFEFHVNSPRCLRVSFDPKVIIRLGKPHLLEEYNFDLSVQFYPGERLTCLTRALKLIVTTNE